MWSNERYIKSLDDRAIKYIYIYTRSQWGVNIKGGIGFLGSYAMRIFKS